MVSSRITHLAISLLIGIYLSLSIVALECITRHGAHHQPTSSHSSVCLWACQISLTSGAAENALPLMYSLLLAGTIGRSHTRFAPASLEQHISTRAPPPFVS
ncbi:MAG: hypothetical protein D6704_01290 [Nitrospirae bacterium]|nr:MAG: hypothetical protein D6704_01290 [Nitrospirota bacterium]